MGGFKLLIIPILLTAKLVNGKEPETYNEVLESLKYPEKLILDIASATNAIQRGKIHKIEESGLFLTPYVFDRSGLWDVIRSVKKGTRDFHYEGDRYSNGYIKQPALILNKTKIRNNSFFEKPLHLEPPFNEADILKTEPSISTLVFHWTICYASNQTKLIQDLTSFKAGRKVLKLAILFTENFHSAIMDINIINIIGLADEVIIELELPLRYSNFIEEFKKPLDWRIYHILKENLNKENSRIFFYIPFRTSPQITSFTQIERNRYFHLILQSSVAWINSGREEGIILDGFQESDGLVNWFAGSNFKDTISAHVSLLTSVVLTPSDLCRFQTVLAKASKVFSNVVLNLDDIKAISSIINNPKKELIDGIAHCKFSPSAELLATLSELRLTVNIFVNNSNSGTSLKDYVSIDDRRINYDLAIFDFVAVENEPKITQEVVLQKQLQGLPSGTKIGCSFGYGIKDSDTDRLLEDIRSKCKSLINQNQADFTLVWDVELEATDLDEAIMQLHTIHNTIPYLQNQLPMKKIIMIQNFQGRSKSSSLSEPDSLYCNPTDLLWNGIGEAVVNFGRVHALPIITRRAVGSSEAQNFHGGWWNPLVVLPGSLLYHKAIAEPVLVARNYPEYLTIPGFPTDPCIHARNRYPHEISLNQQHHEKYSPSSEFSGITFYIDRELSVGQLQTSIILISQKFSLIEIISETLADILLILKVLSSSYVQEKIDRANKIYLQLDGNFLIDNKRIDELQNHVMKATSQITGIHSVNCCINNNNNGRKLQEIFPLLLRNFNSSQVRLGLVVENCVEATNEDFRLILTKLEIFPKVKYLVCNDDVGFRFTDPDEIRINKTKLQSYLDTRLFIHTHSQRIFNNRTMEMELLFRQNPIPYDDEIQINSFSNYLNFISDASEFAKAYKLKTFLGPAFDNEIHNRFGWWEISNFDNLTDLSGLVDKQSEFHGDWKIVTNTNFEYDSKEVMIVGLFIGGIVGLTALVCLFAVIIPLICYRRKFAFMSREEVEHFLNGKRNNSEQTGTKGEEEAENVKFPREYEILDKHVNLLNILGQGNFGVVHNAELHVTEEGQTNIKSVAVKMPLPGCSKESFKSMLSELKVLCYVGIHPNVIQFIGAYIKEIGKGKVYIATEICENGSLINFLRSLQLPDEAHYENVQRETTGNENQMSRFAYEISLGMEYLGSRKIVHGDLSARNVLLDSNLRCKIGDFGLSRKLYEYQKYVKKSQEPLPWRWMALESLQRMEFTTKSDVWSYGITLWEIYSLGGVPYPGLSWTVNFVDELENGLRLTSPANATPSIYEKMIACWNPDSEFRPTFSELASFFRALRDLEYVIVEEV